MHRQAFGIELQKKGQDSKSSNNLKETLLKIR